MNEERIMPMGISLQHINSAALRFLEPISLSQTLETIAHQALDLLDGSDGFILLADKNGELKRAYATNSQDTGEYIEDEFTYQAFKNKMALIHEIDSKNFIVLVPLFYQKKSFGILLIHTQNTHVLEEQELEGLKAFGSLATLAIRKAQLYEENQKSLKIRDIFTSMAAHELKTPLTTVSGYVQLLDTRLGKNESQEAGWVKNLLTETKRMNNLINDMMQTHNIKSGKLEFKWQECHVLEVLERSIISFHFSDALRPVKITSLLEPGKDVVIGDAQKLEQVFDNILDNARKFSPRLSPIQIDVYAEEPYINVEIIDKGVGIPKKDLPHVFEEFYKSTTTDTAEGMGLGLYLVKMILNQHHGRIAISSSKKGTKVTIRLRRTDLD